MVYGFTHIETMAQRCLIRHNGFKEKTTHNARFKGRDEKEDVIGEYNNNKTAHRAERGLFFFLKTWLY